MKRKSRKNTSTELTKKEKISSKSENLLCFETSLRQKLYLQTLQTFRGNKKISTSLHYFLYFILPKDLICLIVEYSKLLWDPDQIKCQFEIVEYRYFEYSDIYQLDPIHVISVSLSWYGI